MANVSIQTLDRKEVREIMAKFEKAAKTFADSEGLDYDRVRASYTDIEVSLKVTFRVRGQDEKGNAVSGTQLAFNKYCGRFGFKPAQFGAKFLYGGEEYTIAGIKPKALMYPLIAVRADGKRFKFSASQVLNCLAVGYTGKVGKPAAGASLLDWDPRMGQFSGPMAKTLQKKTRK